MNEQVNIRIVRELLAAFKRGDLPAVLELCSEDGVVHHPIPKSILPFAGISRGKREVEQFCIGIAETFELDPFEPREFIAQEDKVVVVVFERSRNRATGRAVDNEYVHVYTIKDHKIASVRIYEDTAPILAAMLP